MTISYYLEILNKLSRTPRPELMSDPLAGLKTVEESGEKPLHCFDVKLNISS